MIREVEPDRADAVLTVRVQLPGDAGGHEEQHHLARVRPEPFARVVRTAVDGVESGSFRITAESLMSAGVLAHCTRGSGPGGYLGVTLTLNGRSGDRVVVGLSVSWSSRGEHGESAGDVTVPWLGTATADLPGGARVMADIIACGAAQN